MSDIKLTKRKTLEAKVNDLSRQVTLEVMVSSFNRLMEQQNRLVEQQNYYLEKISETLLFSAMLLKDTCDRTIYRTMYFGKNGKLKKMRKQQAENLFEHFSNNNILGKTE